jgi:ketosteroid isomerase-like protein
MRKMTRALVRIGAAAILLFNAATPGVPVRAHSGAAASADQVRETERAFARSMADRNHAAFVSFLSDEAVFMSQNGTLRGRQAVADGWKRFYEGANPPFSWEPDRVEVIDSGTLGLSSGPVRDPQGRRIGTFNSVWRRETGGNWKIVFDKGCPPCECR